MNGKINLENRLFSKFYNDRNINWINPVDLLSLGANPPTPLTTYEWLILWRDLYINGMKDPLIVTSGTKTGMSRLDSGNHRLYLFVEKKVKIVPIKIIKLENHIHSPDNGKHIGINTEDFMKLIKK